MTACPPVPTVYPADLPPLTRAQLQDRLDAATGKPITLLLELADAVLDRQTTDDAWRAVILAPFDMERVEQVNTELAAATARVRGLVHQLQELTD